jgi:hypothetical protein
MGNSIGSCLWNTATKTDKRYIFQKFTTSDYTISADPMRDGWWKLDPKTQKDKEIVFPCDARIVSVEADDPQMISVTFHTLDGIVGFIIDIEITCHHTTHTQGKGVTTLIPCITSDVVKEGEVLCYATCESPTQDLFVNIESFSANNSWVKTYSSHELMYPAILIRRRSLLAAELLCSPKVIKYHEFTYSKRK